MTSIINTVDTVDFRNDEPGFGIGVRVWRRTGYEFAAAVIERTIETTPGSGTPDVGAAEQIDIMPARVHEMIDRLADDGVRRFYRAELRFYGFNASGWTSWADAVPGDLSGEPVVVVPEWTGPPPTPTGLTAAAKDKAGRCRMEWTSGGGETADFEVRFGLSWATGTHLGFTPDPFFEFDHTLADVGSIVLMVKARNKYKTPSDSYLSVAYVNLPSLRDRLSVLREQIRKKKLGDSDGVPADIITRDGLSVLVHAETGAIGEDLLYLNSEIALADLEPVEGASQKNRVKVTITLKNGETWTAPAGYTIYSVEYLGGGLSVQGASVWTNGTTEGPDDVPGTTAPPTSYGPSPSVDVNGDSLTAVLLLQESTSGTINEHTEPFTTGGSNVVSGIGESGVADVQASELPASDSQYSAGFSVVIGSDKTGAFSVTVALKTWKNGVVRTSDTKVVAGFISSVAEDETGQGTLDATVVGWDGLGQDEAVGEVIDISAPGNWNCQTNFSPLTWSKNDDTLQFADMTPNAGARLKVEVVAE